MYNPKWFSLFVLCLGICLFPGCRDKAKIDIPSVGSGLSGQSSDRVSTIANTVNVKSQEGVPFYTDYELGRKQARERNKPILLFFYTPQCIYSRQMLDEAFRNRDVLKLSEQFVCIQVDESQHRSLCEEFDVDETPTIQFMSAEGILLQRLTAKKRPEQLLHQMNNVIQSVASTSTKNRL